MAHPTRGNNKYLAGITAHNLGVVNVLAGRPDEAITYFREAINMKTIGFGKNNPEVALSCDELGIQLFAKGDFHGALKCFKEAHAVRSRIQDASRRPQQAMVLNNIACCYFELGDHGKALSLLQEADSIQQLAIGSSAQADLDLLHVAIVICNCGYLMLALKDYENARSLFEEALLIQQSVLDDRHRAVRDTLSNLEFANAFHL
jgi:tetratricopeptide (TPR) repeat protein